MAASLGREGILVSQVGRSPSLMDPDETYSRHHGRVKFETALKDAGFASMVSYEEVRVQWMDFSSWYTRRVTTTISLDPTMFLSCISFLFFLYLRLRSNT
jgi:hypothetical protein